MFSVLVFGTQHHGQIANRFSQTNYTCISWLGYGFFVLLFFFSFLHYVSILERERDVDPHYGATTTTKHVNKSQTHKILDFQLRKDKMSTVPYLSWNLGERELWWNRWSMFRWWKWAHDKGNDGNEWVEEKRRWNERSDAGNESLLIYSMA